MTTASPEDRQQAIEILAQRFISLGKDVQESYDVAAWVVDGAIEDRQTA